MASRVLCPWVVWLVPRCAAFGQEEARKAAAVATVEGRVLDLPVVFPDGSIRFHLAVGAPAGDRGIIPVPAGGIRAATAIFEDNFSAGRKPQWRDVLGTTVAQGGRLAAGSPRNDVILPDLREQAVQVSVDAEAAAQMRIMVRYQDQRNFVVAFYTPGPKILGFHEAADGDLGPWLAPVFTAALTGKAIGIVSPTFSRHLPTKALHCAWQQGMVLGSGVACN